MTFYAKPSGVTRLMNSVIGWLASMGMTPKHMITLEAQGRRSGRTRSTVVNWAEQEGQRYLVAPRGTTEWVRNVRAAGGAATIRHGKREQVRLEELPPNETAAIIKTYLAGNAAATKSHFGIEPDAPIEEFERVAPNHPVFRIVSA